MRIDSALYMHYICFTSFLFHMGNFGCGISDWHNLIGVVVKGAIDRVEKRRRNTAVIKTSMISTTYIGPISGF